MPLDSSELNKSLDRYLEELRSIKPDCLIEIGKEISEAKESLQNVDLDRTFKSLVDHKQLIIEKNLSYEELLDRLAAYSADLELLEFHNDTLKLIVEYLERVNSVSEKLLNEQMIRYEKVMEIDGLLKAVSSATNRIEGLQIGRNAQKKIHGKNTADARHSKPGGSREKRKQIFNIWASGKYISRDICAEQECAALDMSFSTARRALRNTPDPDPWPGKKE